MGAKDGKTEPSNTKKRCGICHYENHPSRTCCELCHSVYLIEIGQKDYEAVVLLNKMGLHDSEIEIVEEMMRRESISLASLFRQSLREWQIVHKKIFSDYPKIPNIIP